MSHVEYVICDDCGTRIYGPPPFKIERSAAGTFADPQDRTFDLCSTVCLVRLANEQHRRSDVAT